MSFVTIWFAWYHTNSGSQLFNSHAAAWSLNWWCLKPVKIFKNPQVRYSQLGLENLFRGHESSVASVAVCQRNVPGWQAAGAAVALPAWLWPAGCPWWAPLLTLRWNDLRRSFLSLASSPALLPCRERELFSTLWPEQKEFLPSTAKIHTARITTFLLWHAFRINRKSSLLHQAAAYCTSCGHIFWTEHCIQLPSAGAPHLYSCRRCWRCFWYDWQGRDEEKEH